MIAPIDPTDSMTAARIVEIQRLGYAVEAGLIGFDGIPQLSETDEDVRALTNLEWRGAFDGDVLAGVISWEVTEELIDIDRLAVNPSHARRGHGRSLVRAVPTDRTTIVSTGAANQPAIDLYIGEGFERVGQIEIATGVFLAKFNRDPMKT